MAVGAACVIAAPAAAAAILGYRKALWLASRMPPTGTTTDLEPSAG